MIPSLGTVSCERQICSHIQGLLFPFPAMLLGGVIFDKWYATTDEATHMHIWFELPFSWEIGDAARISIDIYLGRYQSVFSYLDVRSP